MILEYNLQFFAKDGPGGEKTEPATPKKLEDARKDGKVAKSKEMNNAITLLGLFVVLRVFLGNMGTQFLNLFEIIYNQLSDFSTLYNGALPFATIHQIFRMVLTDILQMLLPFLVVSFLIAFVVDLVQVKWRPTAKPLQPKFSKMNPLNGIKRLFSSQSLIELLKSLLKIGLIGFVVYSYIKSRANNLFLLYDMPLFQAVGLVGSMVIDLGLRISAFYLVIAFLDFAYQKWKFKDDMKMTKQEVKDEYKNQEGDPQIKSQQRARMREASRRRMMQRLPEADVVITNPTHYAVAIKYDPEEMDAPYVIAKGADYVAQKIKEVARENHIEIVENKPLARMLYANVEIDQAVPPGLYQAVAEVLAFVYHLQGKI